MGHSKIADALKDTFYQGMMKSKGEFYPHSQSDYFLEVISSRAGISDTGENVKQNLTVSLISPLKKRAVECCSYEVVKTLINSRKR